jgi:hypothetical protein
MLRLKEGMGIRMGSGDGIVVELPILRRNIIIIILLIRSIFPFSFRALPAIYYYIRSFLNPLFLKPATQLVASSSISISSIYASVYMCCCPFD